VADGFEGAAEYFGAVAHGAEAHAEALFTGIGGDP
jgi:hypothetical protein